MTSSNAVAGPEYYYRLGALGRELRSDQLFYSWPALLSSPCFSIFVLEYLLHDVRDICASSNLILSEMVSETDAEH